MSLYRDRRESLLGTVAYPVVFWRLELPATAALLKVALDMVCTKFKLRHNEPWLQERGFKPKEKAA